MNLPARLHSTWRTNLRQFRCLTKWLASNHIWDWLLRSSVPVVTRTRRVRLGVEVLEAREVPSVTLNSIANQSNGENDTVSLQAIGSSSEEGDLLFSANNLPSGLSMDANGWISGTISYSAADQQGGAYPVTVSAGDIDGTVSVSFVWTVLDNTTPSMGSLSDVTNNRGDGISLNVANGSDPDGESLTYTVNNLPLGLTADSNGNISGTIDPSASNSYTVDVTAADPEGASAYTSFTWTVNDADTSVPSMGSLSDLTNNRGDSISLSVANGSDPDGESLTYTASNLPLGLTADAAGNISGTIDPSALSSYTVSVTANDTDGASANTSYTWTVNDDTSVPSMGSLSDLTNNRGDSISLSVANGSDPDGESLTYTVDNLPMGLTADSAGNISGTIDPSALSSYTVTVTANDTDGASANTSYTWTVNDDMSVPSMGSLSDLTNNRGDTVTLSVANGSDPDNESLTYSVSGLPTGLTSDSNGNVTGTIDPSAASSYTVSVTATDPEGMSASASFTWTVNDDTSVPSMGALSDLTNHRGDSVSLSVANGSDPDGEALTYSATNLPTGLSCDANGNITGTIDPSASSGYLVTVTASDTDGASASTSFTWSVTVAATTILWVYTGSGIGDGTDPANWDSDRLPNANDILIFNAGTGTCDMTAFDAGFLVAGLTTEPGCPTTITFPHQRQLHFPVCIPV